MRLLLTALASAIVVLLVTACGAGTNRDAEVAAAPARATGAGDKALIVGRWRVRVAVRPSRLGSIVVAAEDLHRARRTTSGPWVQHDLVLRNTGRRPVTFADTRRSTLIGEAGRNRLLVADHGCGYSQDEAGAPVTAGACLTYLDLLTVEPDAAGSRSITLFKGLAGMDGLVAGTYEFRRHLWFRSGRRPPKHGGRRAVVTVVYDVASR